MNLRTGFVLLIVMWILICAYWIAFALQGAGPIWPKYAIGVVCVGVQAALIWGMTIGYKRD